MSGPTTHDMAEKHELHLAHLLGGRKSPGSGNRWNKAMDGRQSSDNLYAFAWDGKSTFGKSLGVSIEMWEKASMQAHQERPMLALRWYDGPLLRPVLDLVVVSADDFAEILGAANGG